MAFFADQLLRLLREDWPNATMLAQELYAIFSSSGITQVTNPVQVTSGQGIPALTVHQTNALGTPNPAIQSIINGPPPSPPCDPCACHCATTGGGGGGTGS
jgi:hypothetical protein